MNYWKVKFKFEAQPLSNQEQQCREFSETSMSSSVRQDNPSSHRPPVRKGMADAHEHLEQHLLLTGPVRDTGQ